MGIEFSIQVIVLVVLWMAAPRLGAIYTRRWSRDFTDAATTVIRFCVLLAGGAGMVEALMPAWRSLPAVPWFRALAVVAAALVVAMRRPIATFLSDRSPIRFRPDSARAATMLVAGAMVGWTCDAMSSEWTQLGAVATCTVLVWLIALRSERAHAAPDTVLFGIGGYMMLLLLLTWSPGA